MFENIALDPGFGGFKIAGVDRDSGEVATRVLPSVVGIGSTDMGLLSLAGVVRSKRRRVPYRVVYEGVEQLVGPNVEDFARPVERLDFQRLTDTPELRALTYASMYSLLGEGEHEVNIVVGFPVEVFQSGEAKAVVRGLSRWLVGRQEFSVDGRHVVVVVRKIFPIAQPVGAFFEWGLDISGRWARPKDDLKDIVAVLDMGFNTLDLFTVQAGRIKARYTGGDTLGVRRATTALRQALQRQFGVDYSLHRSDELIREYLKGKGRKPVNIRVAGKRVDIRPHIRSAIQNATGEIMAFLDRAGWDDGMEFAYILLTGGGNLLFGDVFRERFPHATLLEDPVTANVRGMAKLAQREGLFK